MPTNPPIHILNQLGVLTSFSVAKKVTEEDINKYFLRHKRKGKTNSQIGKMLKEKILSEIETAVQNNTIPGLVLEQERTESLGLDKKIVERLPELNRLIMILTHKMAEKKYDTMALCYFINSLVNVLGLSEDDFTKFHRQNNIEDEGDEENDNPDDERDEY